MSYKLLRADTFCSIIADLFGNEVAIEWRNCDENEWDWCEEFDLQLHKVVRKTASATGVEYEEVVFDESLNRSQHRENLDSFYTPLGVRLGFELASVEERGFARIFNSTYIFAKELGDHGMPQGKVLIGGGCSY
ncbi:MAG: hypothetical protein J5I93_22905 [Pirellulaceae bacterium]|nr:hypothetical protein [Pirellulaceae bacterium]